MSLPQQPPEKSSASVVKAYNLLQVLELLSRTKQSTVFQLRSQNQQGVNQEELMTVEISYQNITFEHLPNCHLLTIRDISHLNRLAKQQQELKIMEMVTCSVTHEMITPLMSVSLLANKLSEDIVNKDQNKDARLIFSTTNILLSEVKLLLDRSQLNAGRFKANLDKHPVNKTIVNIVEILKM